MQKYGIALLGVLLVGIASAQKTPVDPPKPDEATYTIKIKSYPDRGHSAVTSSNKKSTGSMKISTAAGKVINEVKLDEIAEEVITETVIEKGEREPKQLKKAYTKSTKNGKAASYQGKTILFEQKGGKYVASVDGDGEVPEKDLDELVKNMTLSLEFDMNKAMLPSKPVKVGELWTPDKAVFVKGFSKSMGGELDASKSTMEGKLLRAYKKGDKQFGVIEFKCKLAMTKLSTIAFDTGSFEINFLMDTAIDGSSYALKVTGTSQLKGKGAMERGGAKLTVDLLQNQEMKHEQSEEK